MKMIIIKKSGITMVVPEVEIDFYKRAGYQVVKAEAQVDEDPEQEQPKKPRKSIFYRNTR